MTLEEKKLVEFLINKNWKKLMEDSITTPIKRVPSMIEEEEKVAEQHKAEGCLSDADFVLRKKYGEKVGYDLTNLSELVSNEALKKEYKKSLQFQLKVVYDLYFAINCATTTLTRNSFDNDYTNELFEIKDKVEKIVKSLEMESGITEKERG